MHPSRAIWVEFDDDNLEHLSGHGVSAAEVQQAFGNDPLWASNKKGRAALWLMAGRTAGGRAIIVMVNFDDVRECIRPITARDCSEAEVAKWDI